MPNFDIPGRVGAVTVMGCTCGVKRLAGELDAAGVLETYVSGAYHDSETRHEGVVKYRERYDDDYRVAKLRADRYDALLGMIGPLVLDVGAATGAFVNYLRSEYVDAYGIEPDARFASGYVYSGRIEDADRIHKTWDLITYHDVLEHVVDPVFEIYLAALRLNPFGALVLEVPDVSVPEGLKHYKAEHLWYFTLRSLVDIVRAAGLEFLDVEFPIAGKMTVYAVRSGT